MDEDSKGFNFLKLEKKWQNEWEKKGIFNVKEDSKKKKCYILEMYPYPSGSGLHMGHAFNYIIGDIYSRFKVMRGFNVLHPMGYDSFGLPAENAAIKEGVHPRKHTDQAIARFIEQQKSLGLSYDWSRKIQSHDEEYYKWNQFWFLQLFKKGLVYRKVSMVNWCPKCKTVLANEQVEKGNCWRHKDTKIELKSLEQWFVKTTQYAEELYNEIDSLDWPERIKAMQKNWIGKSEGVEINFKINGKDWPIFTTRPDTIYGVTFMVVSAQHPRLMDLVTKEQRKDVEELLAKIRSTSEKDLADLEKEGAFTGSYAVNPMNGEKVPVWVGNFVVADYGSGMVMAVPAHDQRDFEFAKKYNIPIKVVIRPKIKELKPDELKRAYVDEGILVNSSKFNGMNSKDAINEIADYLEKNNLGKRVVNYKLRDWLISRQRYWGTPIPIVYCEKCGIVPVPEGELPVTLPDDVKFGEGNPLTTNKEFFETKCPKCNGKARRETDTMDTFFDSSWYFLRFCDPKNKKEPFGKKEVDYWMPVDFYIGGAEHACMHLIYARFFTKALRDLGYVKINEPFLKLFNQGMIHGEDGAVMSKSRGNVVDPMEMVEKYGADSLRIFLVSIASPDKDFQWDSAGLESYFKFLKKVWTFFRDYKPGKADEKMESKINSVIKSVTVDIENLRYNSAVVNLKSLFEFFEINKENVSKSNAELFLKMLNVFCPHITQEIWFILGNKGFLAEEKWPEADESKINKAFEEAEKVLEKTIGDIQNILKMLSEKEEKIEKVYLYALPKEVEIYDKKIIERRIGKKVEVFAVNDKNKYDPEAKSAKAKPNKPGIYVE